MSTLSKATSITLSYCTSEEEIDRKYSTEGDGLISDHVSPDPELYWDDVCSEATQIINQYCALYYNESDLVNSTWARQKATWIGCYLASMGRGNPALFLQRYEEILRELELVAQGQLLVPGLATREDFTPSLSNLVVDDRYIVDKIRVHPTISTGGSSGLQSWAGTAFMDWI